MGARRTKLFCPSVLEQTNFSRYQENKIHVFSHYVFCFLPISFNCNHSFLTSQGIDAHLSAYCPMFHPNGSPQHDQLMVHTQTHTLLHSDQVSMGPTKSKQDGLTRVMGVEHPQGRTCLLENLEQMGKNHSSSESHCCFPQTSVRLVNVWNISFILLIMGKKFCGESVFQSRNHCIEMPSVCKTMGPEGCTGLYK